MPDPKRSSVRGAASGAVKLSSAAAKAEILRLLADGFTVVKACEAVGKSPKTYEYYRRTDDAFRFESEKAKVRQVGRERPALPQFDVFSEEYMGQRMFRHQLQWWDLLEGREPRDMDASQTYELGEPDLLIVNTPPEHAKSTTLTMNYVTYRIAENPNVRILIVSKTQEMAKKFLRGIKSRLTNQRYAKMIAAYGPPGGFEKNSAGWSADMIYVSEEARDSGEKDPTVQALGIKGHIYGSRADLIILDDGIDMTNAHDYDNQIEWLQSEVMSRLSPGGKLLVVGTRLQPTDMYLELRNPSRYVEEVSPWTYFAQPAVSEFADDPKDWVTLWPESNQPELAMTAQAPNPNGNFEKWSGTRLNKRRARMSARTWALVYMQQAVVEDAVFPGEAVKGVINSGRRVGLIQAGMPGQREAGMQGLYVVAGLDPAMSGHTAAVVIGLDTQTQKRYLLDVHNQSHMTPDGIRNVIKDFTEKYRVQEWRIEKNAFQSFLTQDREVREFLNSRGVVLREHHTGVNKWDPAFGVASLQTLFHGWREGRALLELPAANTESIKALVEQLVTWFPETKGKTDIVMALWFAEIRCREYVQAMSGAGGSHRRNSFATRNDLQRRSSISMADLESWNAQPQAV